MKRQISSFVIASAVLVGSAFTPVVMGSVEAASVQHSQAIHKDKALVTGISKEIHYTIWNKKKLYSLNSLGSFIGAKLTYNPKTKFLTATRVSNGKKYSISLKVGNGMATVNGKNVKLTDTTKLVGNSIFGDAKFFVQALGGDVLVENGLLISSNGPIKFENVKLNVESNLRTAMTLKLSGKQLYSVQDIAKAFGATFKIDKNNKITISKPGTTLTFNLFQSTLVKNGKVLKVSGAPVKVKGIVYTELNDVVAALGGDVFSVDKTLYLTTTSLITGDTFNPQWINGSTILVTNESASDSRSYLIDTKTKKVLVQINGTEVSVSPDGKKVVFTNESGFIYVMDLVTKKTTTLNDQDDNEKFEFVWSKDGKKVYFFKGKDTKEIAVVNLIDSKISKVYADTLTYKTDLKLSSDGTKILYTVGKEGTTNYTDPDAEGNKDVDNIDLKDTEPQINLLDLTATETKPVTLTNTKDNKVDTAFLPNGTIIYSSYDVDGVRLPELNAINNGKQITLVANLDILSTVVSSQGKIFVLASEGIAKTIYQVDATSKKLTKLVQTNLDVTSFSVSNEGKIVATVTGDNGNRLVVFKNGSFELLTK